MSYDLGKIFNYTNNSFATVISVIKLPGLVWNIQKVIPEGAIFKLGPKRYIHVYVSQSIGGNRDSAGRAGNRMVLMWKGP